MNRSIRWSAVTLLFLESATTRAALAGEVHREVALLTPSHPSSVDLATTGGAPSLAAFVRAVLDRNPSIESARQAWNGATARVRRSNTLDEPMVAVGVAPLSVGSSIARLGFEASISQRLPWPDKLSLAEEAARHEAGAAKADLETTRRRLALAASLLYAEYFVRARSLEVNELHVALVRDLKAVALAQVQSGRGSTQDPIAAETELAHLEHDAVMLTADRDVIVAQMNELLHRDPEAPVPPPPKEFTEATGDVTPEVRPEIVAAKLRARAEQTRAARARRDWIPDLTLSTSYNTMWDQPEHRWMIGVGLDIPLALSRRSSVIDEADAERARMQSEVISLTDKARTEGTIARKRLDEARHVKQLFDDRLIPLAHDQIDAARAGFVTARNDFTAVIAAERNLRNVELEAEKARADVAKRRAEHDWALGRLPGVPR